jgi:hypothetical protein
MTAFQKPKKRRRNVINEERQLMVQIFVSIAYNQSTERSVAYIKGQIYFPMVGLIMT